MNDDVYGDVKFVYTDSYEIAASIHNSNRDVHICSSNPKINLDANLNSIAVEGSLSLEYFTHKQDIIRKTCFDIYTAAINAGESHPDAVFLARYPLAAHSLIHRYASLKLIVKNEKFIVFDPDVGNDRSNRLLRSSFVDLFPVQQFTKVSIKIDKAAGLRVSRDPVTPFLTRLNFEGIYSIIFRLLSMLSRCINMISFKGIIYYNHENNLLKETLVRLVLKGYGLSPIPLKSVVRKIDYQLDERDEILLEALQNPLDRFVEDIALSAVDETAKAEIRNGLSAQIQELRSVNVGVQQAIDSGAMARVAAVFFGFPSSMLDIALIKHLHKNHIPTASFQHGVSREISEEILCVDVLFEASLADVSYVFNQNNKKTLEKSLYPFNEIAVCGLPEDMRRVQKTMQGYNSKAKFLYVSTNLNSGNTGMMCRTGWSDLEKTKGELAIVEKVLSKLRDGIAYKPYFSLRYADKSHEVDVAIKAENIDVIDREIDLRYILAPYDLIITSRATSTVGWCAMAGKPLVFLEMHDNRLSPAARGAFDKAFFVFDALDAEFHNDLLEFLSKPFMEIFALWEDKAEHRQLCIDNFFGMNGGSDVSNPADHFADNFLKKQVSD
jgi:hypothetical protein